MTKTLRSVFMALTICSILSTSDVEASEFSLTTWVQGQNALHCFPWTVNGVTPAFAKVYNYRQSGDELALPESHLYDPAKLHYTSQINGAKMPGGQGQGHLYAAYDPKNHVAFAENDLGEDLSLIILISGATPPSQPIFETNLGGIISASYIGKTVAQIEERYTKTVPLSRCGYSAMAFVGNAGSYVTTFIFKDGRVVAISKGSP